jgi:uncharacterized membrane protein
MPAAVSEWLNLLFRWFHIFTGILWIGSTWYFTWLDFRVREAEARAAKTGEPALVWMVHSGGFYRVEKLSNPDVDPKLIHWFKWEALFTWISGILLLGIVYYSSEGVLTDADVSSLTHLQAVGLCLGILIVGWVIYDLIFSTPVAKNDVASLVVGYALALGVSYLLLREVSPRAAYLHVGALFGTIMMLNVWMRILPAQKRLVRALKDKSQPDQALADRAKLRSKHNTFLVVPLVFTMISNHFPVATYGNDHAFLILAVLIAGGWLVAGLVRGKV